jgi:hypothetical protein
MLAWVHGQKIFGISTFCHTLPLEPSRVHVAPEHGRPTILVKVKKGTTSILTEPLTVVGAEVLRPI